MPRRKVLVPGTFGKDHLAEDQRLQHADVLMLRAACAVFLAINAGLSAALAKDTTNVKLSQGALAA
jgi:hypothetical protein